MKSTYHSGCNPGSAHEKCVCESSSRQGLTSIKVLVGSYSRYMWEKVSATSSIVVSSIITIYIMNLLYLTENMRPAFGFGF